MGGYIFGDMTSVSPEIFRDTFPMVVSLGPMMQKQAVALGKNHGKTGRLVHAPMAVVAIRLGFCSLLVSYPMSFCMTGTTQMSIFPKIDLYRTLSQADQFFYNHVQCDLIFFVSLVCFSGSTNETQLVNFPRSPRQMSLVTDLQREVPGPQNLKKCQQPAQDLLMIMRPACANSAQNDCDKSWFTENKTWMRHCC